MREMRTYVGKDPNLKWKKCQIISRNGSDISVLFSDEILGKISGVVKESELI